MDDVSVDVQQCDSTGTEHSQHPSCCAAGGAALGLIGDRDPALPDLTSKQPHWAAGIFAFCSPTSIK